MSLEEQLMELKMEIARRLEEKFEDTIDVMGIPSNIPKELSLRESHAIVKDGQDVIIGSTMPYAAAVEFGRPPGIMPPVGQILIEWVIAKLGVAPDRAKSVAWAVATNIKKNGIQPQPYMETAIVEFVNNI